MLLRGWETGRGEEGQSATCTVRRRYGPSSSPSSRSCSDQATRSRHQEGSFSAAAGAAAAPHGCPQRRAGRWMQPAQSPPPRCSRTAAAVGAAPRLTSAGGGGRRCEGGGGGVGPERGRRRVGGHCPSPPRGGEQRRQPRAERPGTRGKVAGCSDHPPSLRPTFPSSMSAGNISSPPASGCASAFPRHPLTLLPLRCPVGCPGQGTRAPRALGMQARCREAPLRRPGARAGPGVRRGCAQLPGCLPLAPSSPLKAREFRCAALFTTSMNYRESQG